ncbi:uncharacterized protein LOC117109441 isoform X2 [Anneissia japonica]|nr:uncharacterized protein LOC117109441 isoform X2 [Anneissia japonica]
MADNSEPDVHAEPVPEWDSALDTWSWAWQLHTYGIGVAFCLLGVYCVYTTIMLLKYNRGKLKSFFITINVLVLLLCFLRAVYLIVDPYRSREIFSELVSQMFFNVAFPCLTSGFSLVNWAFLESSKFKLLSPKLQNARLLVAIIIIHFVFVLTVDFVLAFVSGTWILVMLCQGTFIVWGLILCIGFSYSAWRVYNIKKNVRSTMYQMNDSRNGVRGRFKFRKTDKQKNKRQDPGNKDLGVMADPDTQVSKLSLIADKYNCLKEEPCNALNDQQPMQFDQDKSADLETDKIQSNAALNGNISNIDDFKLEEEMKAHSDNDVIVKTVYSPNTVVDANGTHNTAKALYDSTNEKENKAPIDSPNSYQSNEACGTLAICEQSNSSKIDIVSSEISNETVNNINQNETVYRRNTLSNRASVFLTSIKENRFLRRQNYGVKPVKRLTISRQTSVTKKMIRITLITTAFAAIICLISTYAMFGVFSVLSDDKDPEPWGWFAFQTVMRLCELGMAATMVYLTTKPMQRKRNFQQQSKRETE